MWFEIIEKRRKANGLKRERSKRSYPLETSSLSLLVIVGIQVAIGSKPMGNSEIGSTI
jgi:hypothetical protein